MAETQQQSGHTFFGGPDAERMAAARCGTQHLARSNTPVQQLDKMTLDSTQRQFADDNAGWTKSGHKDGWTSANTSFGTVERNIQDGAQQLHKHDRAQKMDEKIPSYTPFNDTGYSARNQKEDVVQSQQLPGSLPHFVEETPESRSTQRRADLVPESTQRSVNLMPEAHSTQRRADLVPEARSTKRSVNQVPKIEPFGRPKTSRGKVSQQPVYQQRRDLKGDSQQPMQQQSLDYGSGPQPIQQQSLDYGSNLQQQPIQQQSLDYGSNLQQQSLDYGSGLQQQQQPIQQRPIQQQRSGLDSGLQQQRQPMQQQQRSGFDKLRQQVRRKFGKQRRDSYSDAGWKDPHNLQADLPPVQQVDDDAFDSARVQRQSMWDTSKMPKLSSMQQRRHRVRRPRETLHNVTPDSLNDQQRLSSQRRQQQRPSGYTVTRQQTVQLDLGAPSSRYDLQDESAGAERLRVDQRDDQENSKWRQEVPQQGLVASLKQKWDDKTQQQRDPNFNVTERSRLGNLPQERSLGQSNVPQERSLGQTNLPQERILDTSNRQGTLPQDRSFGQGSLVQERSRDTQPVGDRFVGTTQRGQWQQQQRNHDDIALPEHTQFSVPPTVDASQQQQVRQPKWTFLRRKQPQQHQVRNHDDIRLPEHTDFPVSAQPQLPPRMATGGLQQHQQQQQPWMGDRGGLTSTSHPQQYDKFGSHVHQQTPVIDEHGQAVHRSSTMQSVKAGVHSVVATIDKVKHAIIG